MTSTPHAHRECELSFLEFLREQAREAMLNINSGSLASVVLCATASSQEDAVEFGGSMLSPIPAKPAKDGCEACFVDDETRSRLSFCSSPSSCVAVASSVCSDAECSETCGLAWYLDNDCSRSETVQAPSETCGLAWYFDNDCSERSETVQVPSETCGLAWFLDNDRSDCEDSSFSSRSSASASPLESGDEEEKWHQTAKQAFEDLCQEKASELPEEFMGAQFGGDWPAFHEECEKADRQKDEEDYVHELPVASAAKAPAPPSAPKKAQKKAEGSIRGLGKTKKRLGPKIRRAEAIARHVGRIRQGATKSPGGRRMGWRV